MHEARSNGAARKSEEKQPAKVAKLARGARGMQQRHRGGLQERLDAVTSGHQGDRSRILPEL